MTKNKIYKILILFLSLVLPSALLFAKNDNAIKLYPVPLPELMNVLNNWLVHANFDVTLNSLQMGQIQLHAKKLEERWDIILRPQSPLATIVQADYFLRKQNVGAQHVILWDYLDDYINSINSNSISNPHSEQIVPPEILQKKESVVCIAAKQPDEVVQFSGFIVDKFGLVICTAHGLGEAQEITVTLHNGQKFKGKLLKRDQVRDLALLKISLQPDSFISLTDSRNILNRGERLYSIGCPQNHGDTIFPGTINGPPRRLHDFPLWSVDMEVHPGSSGSPVLDAEGNLVAVVKGKLRDTNSVAFLIPLETLIEFLR